MQCCERTNKFFFLELYQWSSYNIFITVHSSFNYLQMAFSQLFKVPQILTKRKHTDRVDPTIARFDCNELPVKSRIAQGSFGEVYTTDYKAPGNGQTQTVVIKKMLQVQVQFLQNFMQFIHHYWLWLEHNYHGSACCLI